MQFHSKSESDLFHAVLFERVKVILVPFFMQTHLLLHKQ